MLAVKQIILIFLFFYFMLLLYLYFQQKNLIFFPTRAEHTLNDPESAEYTVENGEAVLRGWIINHRSASDKLIIYYGGNAEDIFFSQDEFKSYRDTATLLMNYRGYSNSDGNPSELALFEDALTIFDAVTDEYRPKRVYLMGRSLGSGVAAYVSAKREVSGCILITPYDSIEAVAQKRFPYMPVSLLLQHKFRTVDYVPDIDTPFLIIYGGRDRTIPAHHTEQLMKHIKSEKEVIYIREAEHNNIELFDEYRLAILKFIH